MKSKRTLTLLVIAIPLLLMGVAFIAKRGTNTATTSQAQTLSDWAYGSAGTLKVLVTYPTELLTNQKNTITLTYEADSILESSLSNGYVFDAEFDAGGSVITPQKRMLAALESGRHSFTWEVVPFATDDGGGVIQLALGGSDLTGAYAISPQVNFDLPFEVRQSNGLSPNSSFIIGLVMVGLAALLFVVFIYLNKKSFGAKG